LRGSVHWLENWRIISDVLSLDEILTRRDGVEQRNLPNERGAVLVDMNTGDCFRLNRVGAEVWGMLASGVTLRNICDRIASTYREPVSRIEAEVLDLVRKLVRQALVELAAP
jgi:hypothetical protein